MPEPAPVPLNCRTTGAGRPVLLLHGLLGSGNNMGSLARHLQERYQILSLDLRNHGRSGQSCVMNYPAMAVDVLHFLERQGIDQCALVGHSMGGKVAMQLAFLYPECLHKLVVVDIAPKAYPPQNLQAVDALLNLDLTSVSRLSQADEQLQQAIPDPSERLSHLKNLKRGPEGTYHWQVNLEAIRRSYEFISGAVTNGTYAKACLFVRGWKSDYIQDADWDDVLECFPLARLESIPNAGHWIHIQARQLFVKTVLAFLAAKETD